MQITLSVALLAAATLFLSACKKAEAPAAAEPNRAPNATVTPQPAYTPASANATGPAEGSTAIGGPAANQDQGGQNTNTPPAPTGGDGAAQAPPKH